MKEEGEVLEEDEEKRGDVEIIEGKEKEIDDEGVKVINVDDKRNVIEIEEDKFYGKKKEVMVEVKGKRGKN